MGTLSPPKLVQPQRAAPMRSAFPRPLTRWSVIVGGDVFDLDPETVRELLGGELAADILASIKLDVGAAIVRFQAGVQTGILADPERILGVPLADWLTIDDVVRLLHMGGAPLQHRPMSRFLPSTPPQSSPPPKPR